MLFSLLLLGVSRMDVVLRATTKDRLRLLDVALQASRESTACGFVAYELPKSACDSVEGGLVTPTVNKLSEDVLDLCDLFVEVFSAVGQGERDFSLVSGGWDALDEFGFDQTID